MDRGQVLAAYASAWARTSEEAIREALDQCWTEHSTYVSPLTDVLRGFHGLTMLILDLPVMFPGASFIAAGEPDGHHDVALLPWRLRSSLPIRTLGRNFGRVLEGVDVIEFDETDRIRRSTAFFGLMLPTTAPADHAPARPPADRRPGRRTDGMGADAPDTSTRWQPAGRGLAVGQTASG
ncbi:MAG TPA: hypothetical protein VI248_23730 [Kineosporiaceae bacterium]